MCKCRSRRRLESECWLDITFDQNQGHVALYCATMATTGLGLRGQLELE